MFKRFHLLPRLFPLARPFRGKIVVIILLTVLMAAIGLFEPWPLAFLIDGIIGKHSAFPSIFGFAEDWGIGRQILFAVILGLTFTAVSHGLTVVQRAVDTRVEMGMVLNTRRQLFDHVQTMSFEYHDRGVSAHYIYLINELAHDVGTILTGLIPLAEAFLTLIGMFIIVYLLDPQIAIAATLVVPLICYATTFYGKRIEPKLLEVRELEGESIRIVHDRMSVIKVVVAFCRQSYESRRFTEQATRAVNARVDITIKQATFSLVIAVLTAAGTAIVLYLGANAVVRDELTVGQLTAILAYVASVYKPVHQITNTFSYMQFQLIRIEMLFDAIDHPAEVRDLPDAGPLRDPKGHIEFRDVSFDYKERELTLQGISLTIEPGEFVAIVGPTGAGKSTMVGMIPRFFDPYHGSVLIDGQDVRTLTLDSVRGAVGIVQQDPLLFRGTLFDNIHYGRLDATPDEVYDAARMANCHDFIVALPDGYDTELGERGSMISGGERQRISVARAFLKNAPILILDEPTSSIDSQTEGVILEALERIAVGRTTVMIAHRLSTVRRADRIVVVDGGRLVEQGTQAELMAADGPFAAMWRAQFGGSDPLAGSVAAVEPDDPSGAPAVAVELPHDVAEPVLANNAAARVELPALAGVGAPFEIGRRPKVVVLGMMTKIPVAGVVWQTMHYLVGLERLGVEVYYVEAHARTPSMFMDRETDDGSTRAAAFIADTMHRFGFDGRWAFHALHDDGAVFGMSKPELQRLYAEAEVIINLHGGTEPLPDHGATGRLVYVETDPVQLQIELYDQDPAAIAFLEPHVAFFTFGENYGRPDCGLPVSERFRFLPTRQPVVREFWDTFGNGPAQSFTTIGNWRQPWREVRFKGETYHWTKHLEFLKFVDLPQRTGQRFELALSSYADDDRLMLESAGWHIAHALDFSIGLDSYRSYVGGSRGEFTVAKDQNVRLRTGWFSDRSATYLAAGRPVITQDTGFGNILPTGEGLFAFSGIDDVTAAVAEINSDYERHRRAAKAIAREYFDHEAVLRPMLDELGVPLAHRRPRPSEWDGPMAAFPPELDLTVVRRRPTTLVPATASAVLGAPLPQLPDELSTTGPAASIIVVVHDNLVFTRLCLESVLANTGRPDVEVIVVDNASTDMTPSYLEALAGRSPRVRPFRNDQNLGFASAVNQGLAKARGDTLVLLNNDTVVAPGWLDRLERHLLDPTVGMVGPMTNACPNEARIDVPYASYGEFLAYARDRAESHDGTAFDIDVLTMFCVALRRDVFEQVGPLDERFEVGMFEDDDYAVRLRASQFRSLCANDVIVHHFGEATIGKLVPTGDHARIFVANKQRFEHKWATEWAAHRVRPSTPYVDMVAEVRSLIERSVPAGATVLVVSKGDDELLDVADRAVWHFPRGGDGGYAGWYAGDVDEVIEHLDVQIEQGAEYVVFPESAAWWFDFYDGLDGRIASRCDEITAGGACRIFAVRQRSLIGEDVHR